MKKSILLILAMLIVSNISHAMNPEKSRAKKSLKAECSVLLEEYLQVLHVYETETDKAKKAALKKYVHERAGFYKERCYDNGYFEPTLID